MLVEPVWAPALRLLAFFVYHHLSKIINISPTSFLFFSSLLPTKTPFYILPNQYPSSFNRSTQVKQAIRTQMCKSTAQRCRIRTCTWRGDNIKRCFTAWFFNREPCHKRTCIGAEEVEPNSNHKCRSKFSFARKSEIIIKELKVILTWMGRE
jgi:hypothetical protein